MSEHDLEKTPEVQYATLEFLGFEARIGRLRYVVWQLGLSVIFLSLCLVGFLLGIVSPVISIGIIGTGSVLYVVFSFRIAAQRMHDLNFSAWILLLQLVPVANLIFGIMALVKPGTPGSNRFGAPPPPNSTSVKIAGSIWVFICCVYIAGFIALASTPLMLIFINAVNPASL